MSVDKDLLKNVMSLTQKKAYAPPAPAMPPMDPSMMGGGMPPMDPSMMGGGMPPMDPSMMGGMPPMDPSMMGGMPPMDPSMMGGMPPMDPSMMGMDPSMMGMDPSMMGGMPPMDPSMVGALGQGGEGMPEDPAAAGGETVQVSLDDLRALFEETAGAPEEGPGTAELDSRLDGIESMLSSVMNALDISMPPEMMAPQPGAEAEAEIPAMEEGIPGEEPLPPEAMTMPEASPAGDPLAQLPPGVPKVASISSLVKEASGAEGNDMLLSILKKMNNYT